MLPAPRRHLPGHKYIYQRRECLCPLLLLLLLPLLLLWWWWRRRRRRRRRRLRPVIVIVASILTSSPFPAGSSFSPALGIDNASFNARRKSVAAACAAIAGVMFAWTA